MTGSRDKVTILGLSGGTLFLPSVLLWMLFASSAAQSATLTGTFAISPGVNYEFPATGNLTGGPKFFGLDVGGSDVNTIIAKVSTQPRPNDYQAVAYTLDKVSSLSDFENDTGTSDFIDSGVDGLSALLLAGMDYVLTVSCPTCSNSKTSITNTSAVPLPAAAWLFGSALVGFILMSNRRSV